MDLIIINSDIYIIAETHTPPNLHDTSTPTSPLCTTHINLLTPNINYSGHTAPLTSKVAFYIFIQQI